MTKELAASGFSTFNSSMSINLADFIAPVPDFPKPGILFRDISPLLAAPEAFKAAVRGMAELVQNGILPHRVSDEIQALLIARPAR